MRSSNSKKSNGPIASSGEPKPKASSTRSKNRSGGIRTHANGSVGRKIPARSSEWTKLLDQNPALRELLDNGIRLIRQGKPHEALVPLEKARSLFPEAAPLLWYLGSLYLHEMNQPKKALPLYRRASKLDPQSEKASLGVFHSLWGLDRQVEALDEIKRYQTLTNCSSQDYIEIVAEINEKPARKKPSLPPTEKPRPRREKRA